jgi:hypothetical protein
MPGELKANTRIRRRNNKSAAKKKGTNGIVVQEQTNRRLNTKSSSEGKTPPSKSLKQLVWKSPMTWITVVIMVPYTLYNLYLILFLQYPHIVSNATMNIIKLRPSIKLNETRQVLILGSMSSGTTQVSNDLHKKLGLEIGHENSETNWSFVRDGTVSWFHAIGYLPRPGIDFRVFKKDHQKIQNGEAIFQSSVDQLCQKLYPHMGFHPFAFRDGACNLRQSWDSCWRDECKELLNIEWGCALKHKDGPDEYSRSSSDNKTCLTPYRKVLHQVREPLKTIASLVTKFCIDGVNGRVQPPFVAFASALFPQHDFSSMSCIEAAGYYVVEYNNALLKAELDGIFQVEEMTPCAIAEMAGFTDEDVVFHPSKDRVLNICKNAHDDANKLMKSMKNRYNKNLLSLEWGDLLGGIHGSKKKTSDHDLQQRVQKLTHELGYH